MRHRNICSHNAVPSLTDNITEAVVGQRLLIAICVFHTLKTVSARLVIVRNKTLRANFYAHQIAVCVIPHSVRLPITAGNGGQIVIAVVAVADRAAVGAVTF